MALPTITNNSPSAGYIAWTAFGIQYNGTSYTIAAGNSNNAYIWWEFATNTVKTASAGALPTLADADLLLFINKAGIGALVPMMNVQDGSLIVNGSILAAAIGVDQVNATHILAGSIGVSELGANSVTANAVAAGAITAEKLSVGSIGDSLISNGSFEDISNGLPVAWSSTGLANGGSVDVVTGVASSGTNAARLVATGTTSTATLLMLPGYYVPVTASFGRKWYINANVGAGTAITTGFNLRARWYDAAKAYISSTDILVNQAVATSWAPYEGQVTPPSTARYMNVELTLSSPNVATNLYVDEVSAREVVVAAVIGDGQITAAKIAANAIIANSIAVGALDGKSITGATIVGGQISTTATANAIQANMGQVSAWDGSGTRPGIGFLIAGSTDAPGGMYTATGSDTVLTQGKASTTNFQYADLTLNNNNWTARAANTMTLNSYNNMNLISQFGNMTINGGVNLSILSSSGLDMNCSSGVRINGKAQGFNNYLEFSNTMTGVPNSTVWGVGMPASVTARSTTSIGMAAFNGNDNLTFAVGGIYVITFTQNIGAGATGRSFIQMQMGYDTMPIARSNVDLGEDVGTTTATVRINANEYVTFSGYQTTGAARTTTNRIRVTRISDL